MKALALLLLLLGLSALSLPGQAHPLPDSASGFFVSADQRFDPAVQRFLAQAALAAMPLQNGTLYYIYPIDPTRGFIEQSQLRNLQALLAQRGVLKLRGNATSSEPDAE